MQMFVLDTSPITSAQCLCDAHIRVIGREVSMCLSAWYARNNFVHTDELPYKMFNHPVVWQFNNPYTRRWAFSYARNIFEEFYRRFGKVHASLDKFCQVRNFMCEHDNNMNPLWTPDDVCENARFSFISKGNSVDPDLDIYEAIAAYRIYYRYKITTMRVPVRWTARTRPWWLEEK